MPVEKGITGSTHHSIAVMQPWEFNEHLDTAKSFQGFACYRDLGPTRSLDAAFALYRQQNSNKTASGFFNNWSTSGHWVDRVLKFDLESDRIRLEGIQGEARIEHERRLEEVRSVAEAIALARLQTSLRSALLVRDTISSLQDECKVDNRCVMDEAQASRLLLLVSIQSKDAATIEATLKLADEALGIQLLQDKLTQQ
ncbi:MAG: hypothetical protein H7237_00530 [Alkalinema sp. FL-bin-369]|nr:hypothetical protein [Leptolyngbyaceae cyanobacterium LF-bin-369]